MFTLVLTVPTCQTRVWFASFAALDSRDATKQHRTVRTFPKVPTAIRTSGNSPAVLHFEVLEDASFPEFRQSPSGDVKKKYHDAFGPQDCWDFKLRPICGR
jgi:hypothetical protein